MTTLSRQDRFYLIAQLEAHYGRWLRECVLTEGLDCMKAAERDPDKTLKFSTLGKIWESSVEIALEGRQLIQAAREIEDPKTLEILVKWQTLPKWRELMEADGWAFDRERMNWTHPEHGSMLSTP